ncbi:MAG TPA: 30S ribosomal protein S12 methylthiotransferase RimO [Mycobacteriales bacterium]|jgi:ribosomal protein S12 methylthiotransferase RimO|nr:30S ribosomal protein S12 methylthiotransferase RimO [Mycobacteriales bacterium]
MSTSSPRVALLTLGCARNEVDSEELAGRLDTDDWQLVDDADNADVVVVNTCGFVEQAKQESIDTLLAAADSGAKVVAVGCLAQRYGKDLADSLPEADAVLSFDDYADISRRLESVLAGEVHPAHTPGDRRKLLPLSPAQRDANAVSLPGHGAAQASSPTDLPAGVAPASGPRVLRRRLGQGPFAPLKLASGCDRRCTFCAIPSFRGAFISRPAADVLSEAAWLTDQHVRELVLVSENSTSYGKDLGDPRLLEQLLGELAKVPGALRSRVSYLQPAEMRPSLVSTIATTPGIAPYFDLSFQHASPTVLRRMRRFGGTEPFLELLGSIRKLAPTAGARSNFIVGFPGETEADVAELERFLSEARLDAVGVFAYSDEDGTEAADFDDKIPAEEVAARYDRVSRLAEELTSVRAEERVGETVEVIIDQGEDDEVVQGYAAHQAPEVDGATIIDGGPDLEPGDVITATVVDSYGVDLIARYSRHVRSN